MWDNCGEDHYTVQQFFFFLNVVKIYTTVLGYFRTAESGNGVRFSPSGRLLSYIYLKKIRSCDFVSCYFVSDLVIL